jgi:hypothetical protein
MHAKFILLRVFSKTNQLWLAAFQIFVPDQSMTISAFGGIISSKSKFFCQ